MGSGVILGPINEFFSQLSKYFNPVGKFYIKVQVLCRALVCNFFLDDLFKSNGLEYDTKQVGCEQNGVNRFAPINYKKLLELELFTVLLATIIVIGLILWNEHMIKQQEKKKGEVTQDWMASKSMTRQRLADMPSRKLNHCLKYGWSSLKYNSNGTVSHNFIHNIGNVPREYIRVLEKEQLTLRFPFYSMMEPEEDPAICSSAMFGLGDKNRGPNKTARDLETIKDMIEPEIMMTNLKRLDDIYNTIVY